MIMRSLVGLLFVALVSLSSSGASAVPSTERLVAVTSSYYSSAGKPDTYLLTQQGGFEGWFYAPFTVGDMASRGHELLIGHQDSGTIARMDLDGGLVGLINTPLSQIGGLAVASNGDLFVSEENSN